MVTEQAVRMNSPASLPAFYPLNEAFCQVGDDDIALSLGRSPVGHRHRQIRVRPTLN